MTSRVTPASTVVATTDQLSTDLEGETVILHLRDGIYYGLDAVGTFVWQRLAEPRSIAGLVDDVVARYDVGRERCEKDLLALIDELAARGLVAILDAPAR